MTSRLVLIAALTLAGSAVAASVSSAACPPLASTSKAFGLQPAPASGGSTPGRRLEAPSVGDRLRVTIPPSDDKAPITAVSGCFDDVVTMMPEPADMKDPANAVFLVTVPPTATTKSGALPPGDHQLTMYWTYGDEKAAKRTPASYQYNITFKPVVTGIHVLPITNVNRTFRVTLTGDGFDQNNRTNNLIVTESGAHDVCWTGTSACTASANTIRATVAGPNAIVLENVDPTEEATERFAVCYREQSDARCSSFVADDTGERSHWSVIAAAMGVLIAVAALIVLLLVIGRNAFVIWGERYVLSVLLLDKETDTYSLSKLQFYIWTAVAVFGYAYLTISRFYVQHWHELPPIPSGLPGIVGISAGAAVGAQVVTQINGPKGAGKLHPSLSDLITTGNVVVAERVQFLVWTLIGAAGFFLAVTNLDPRTIVDLPDVPQSILAISGISAFGYLGGKLARNAGPVINEVIIRTGPDPDVVPNVTGQPAPAGAPTASASAQFGLIDLRGRMLSQDATFKVSRRADADADDFQLAFDRLEPSPNDDKHLQKPRVIERDAGSDETLAKRLLLVVRLDQETSAFFIPKSKHTLTVTNPDSQKVVFKYDVPETQKPS